MTARWEDREAIRRVMQRYARAIDSRDHDALADLFDPEGEVVGAGGTKLVPDYLAGLQEQPRTFAKSMHVLGDPLVELDAGAGTATADTYAVVYQLGRADGGDDLTLGMRYLDDLRRCDPAPDAAGPVGVAPNWCIVRRTSEILWMK